MIREIFSGNRELGSLEAYKRPYIIHRLRKIYIHIFCILILVKYTFVRLCGYKVHNQFPVQIPNKNYAQGLCC